MHSTLLIGIDGGGTKTRVQASSGNPLHSIFSRDYPASNYNNESAADITALFGYIRADLQTVFGEEAVARARLVLGSAGIDRPSDITAYEEILARSGFACPFRVCNNALIVLVGANGARSDALLLAGTGSIAVGIAKDGTAVRTGGWGSSHR